MAITLYDISVATFLQTLEGVIRVLDKGRAHCEAEDRDPDEIVPLKLAEDMLAFNFQIHSVAHHSLGSIQGLLRGEFRPPSGPFQDDYAGLQQLVRDARDELAAFDTDKINALTGKEVIFIFGEYRLPFVAENFILSFSLPNLFFHAATAYDLLRKEGVSLGKRDFMGPLRSRR